jgi:hypothetical protein
MAGGSDAGTGGVALALLGFPEDLADLLDLRQQLVGHGGIDLPFVPDAPASFVASLNRVRSCGYFSKCSGLK